MIKLFVTPSRVRSAIADARTEADAVRSLRAAGIRCHYSTEGGALHVKVPTRSGSLRIIRVCSRSAPLRVLESSPAGAYAILASSQAPRFWPNNFEMEA